MEALADTGYLHRSQAEDNVVEGRLAAIDYTGEVAQLVVDAPAGSFPVDLGTADGAWRGLATGAALRLGWRAADTLWFAA